MASLLLLKHSSFCHCSSTIKQPFTITILKIYLKYRQFLYHYLHYFFLQGNPIPARSVVEGFF